MHIHRFAGEVTLGTGGGGGGAVQVRSCNNLIPTAQQAHKTLGPIFLSLRTSVSITDKSLQTLCKCSAIIATYCSMITAINSSKGAAACITAATQVRCMPRSKHAFPLENPYSSRPLQKAQILFHYSRSHAPNGTCSASHTLHKNPCRVLLRS